MSETGWSVDEARQFVDLSRKENGLKCIEKGTLAHHLWRAVDEIESLCTRLQAVEQERDEAKRANLALQVVHYREMESKQQSVETAWRKNVTLEAAVRKYEVVVEAAKVCYHDHFEMPTGQESETRCRTCTDKLGNALATLTATKEE